MKKVLMIAYWFPPFGWSGAQRTVKFAKYLSAFGWEPIILTVDKKDKSKDVLDESLLHELPKDLRIYKSKYLGIDDIQRFVKRKDKVIVNDESIGINKKRSLFKDILHTFCIPDNKIGWYPFAVGKGSEIFKENDIDLIYSTSPTPVAHLIAMSLAKKFKKPWVADFRDPWLLFSAEKRVNGLLEKLDISMGDNVLKKAQKIIVAWPAIQECPQPQYTMHRAKTQVIHNGYDEQDFQGIKAKRFKTFTIVHTGTIFKQRSPEAFFRAVSLLITRKILLKSELNIVFIGKNDPFVDDLIKENDLSDIVSLVSYLPHKECLSYLLGADALFLNTVENYVPGKLFEYIRSQKPILALVPATTTVAQIVNSLQAGVVLEPDDTVAITNGIFELYQKYKKGALVSNKKSDSEFLQYERKNLTANLATVFDELT